MPDDKKTLVSVQHLYACASASSKFSSSAFTFSARIPFLNCCRSSYDFGRLPPCYRTGHECVFHLNENTLTDFFQSSRARTRITTYGMCPCSVGSILSNSNERACSRKAGNGLSMRREGDVSE